MPKFCHECGIQAHKSAKYCGDCGVNLNEVKGQQSELISKESSPSIDERILVNLREYDRHMKVTCLDCGYVGLMGISRTEEGKPKKRLILLAFIFIVVSSIFFGGVGVIVSVGIGLYIAMESSKRDKTFVVCPSCLEESKII
jgi:hypothetical protein